MPPRVSDEQKSIAENLYKKNVELSVKNKTLSVLRRLYEISILALETRNLAERISSAIRDGFVFDLVGIFIYDKDRQELSPISIAESSRMSAVQNKFFVFFDKINLSIEQSGFINKVITSKEMAETSELSDIWGNSISSEMANEIVSVCHVKSSIVYPLVSGGRVMGILLFSLNRLYGELIDYERDSIRSFINVVAVALDKSLSDEEIKDLNRRLKSVNSILGHDVKATLGKNRDMFKILIDQEFGPTPEKAKPFIEQLYVDTNRLISSVLDILASGQDMIINPTQFDLKSTVLDVVNGLEKQATEKGLKLETEIADADYNVVADKNQLITHVLMNLVENAIYYTPNGSISVKLSRSPDNKFLFSVSDTGVGISEEDKPNLFKEGSRGKDSLQVNVHSSGYGLAIAKRTVEAHRGRIWFTSEGVGKGSTFYVELPLAQTGAVQSSVVQN